MSSLKADFDELRERIRHGRELGHASFEPIYYLIFDPKQILEAKRQTPAWIAKLHQDGWDVHAFSIAEQLWDLLKSDPFWSLCVMEDKSAPLDWLRTNKALADILTADNGLLKRLEDALQPLEGQPNALLLVTDLEALHPFLRIGAIESQLQGKFHVPTIFLYPGVRTGKTRLKFLGFYPEDGNYRSVHVGG
ncbi:MAG: BREX protein BrxB domain-containing protein [Thiotrichales bacterium]